MSTNADLEALAEELRQLRNDLHKVAKTTERLVKDAGEEAVEMGEDTWRSAKEKVERKIEERPLGSAAIALGIGVVLGLLVGGRR